MKALIIFLCLLFFQSSHAQWNRVEEITSQYVFSALFSGDDIFIGTDTLYISRNRGIAWESKTITGEPADIAALFKADGRIFAGIYGSGVYQSTDDGSSWQPFNTGLGAWAEYAKTFALSGDTLFYGTDGGGVYYLKLNSSSWQSYNQNLPSNYAWTINDLAVSNTNIIASSGGSGFHYLRSKGSAEWIERSIITPGGVMTTPNVFLESGDTIFAGSHYGIFRSFDNGYSWDSVGVRALPLDVVAFTKDNNRIYAGFTRFNANDFFVWYSDDYGDTWNFKYHEFQYLFNLYIYDNKIWAATADGLWFNELEPTSAEPIEAPFTFKLEQNFPNPFNPETRIQFAVGSKQHVLLKVFDTLGKEIAVLVDEEKSPGIYNVCFNASGLSSGIYFYQLQAGDAKEVKMMSLIK